MIRKIYIFILTVLVVILGASFSANDVHAIKTADDSEGGFYATEQEYEEKYNDEELYSATKCYRYRERKKETVVNGYPSYSGYSFLSKKNLGSFESGWLVEAPEAGTINGKTYQTVATVSSLTAKASYGYYTDDKQKCWKATNDGFYPNLLKVYSSTSVAASGYSKDTDGSYFLPRTISTSSPGKLKTIYRISYGGKSVDSFTAGANLKYTFLWPTITGSQKIYKKTTTKFQYTHWKWGPWGEWSNWTTKEMDATEFLEKDSTVMYYIVPLEECYIGDPESPPGEDPELPNPGEDENDENENDENENGEDENGAESGEDQTQTGEEITEATLSSDSFVFDGTAKRPEAFVFAGDIELEEGTDYTILYSNNIDVGEAEAVVTGIGSYSGSITAYFTIHPRGVSISELSKGKKKMVVKWKSPEEVYYDSIDGFEIMYSKSSKFSHAKKVSVSKDKTSKTITKLSKKKTYYVKMRTYTYVENEENNSECYSSWSAIKKIKIK